MSVQSREIMWRHSDSTPDAVLALALGAKQYVTKPDGTPFTTADRVRLLRALGVATVHAIETAKTGGTGGVRKLGEMETRTLVGGPLAPAQFPSKDHASVAGVLAIPFLLFADPGRRPVYSAVTHDGDPAVLDERASWMIGEGPRAANDTAFPPLLIALVIVVAAAAWTAAVCYATQCAANIVDRKLGADTATARMVAAHATAVQIVDLHNQREEAAGHPLAYTPEEKQILDASLGAAAKVAAETRSALPDPFMEATKKAGDAANKVAAAAEDAAGGFGLGLAVIAAVGAYVWMRR